MFFFSYFSFNTSTLLATGKNVPKQNKANNKENVRPAIVRQNEPNRAILAVSIVKNNSKVSSTTAKIASTTNFGAIKKNGSSIASSTTSLKNNGTSNSNNNKVIMVKSVSHQKLNVASKLYDYHEIQKSKREELVRKLKAEEEKEMKFKFHAKPVPKFVKTAPTLQALTLKQQAIKEMQNEIKKRLTKQQSMPNLLAHGDRKIPLVPSCADPERMKAKDDTKKRLIEKYKPENFQFKAKPAFILQQPVFQPKHNFKAVDAKPFKLTLTNRLIQRQTFDKQLQQNQAIKERQKEILQRQKDMEERKVLRKDREFRANPNPFGR